MEYGFWSIIPPVITIVLALVTKNVFVSLFVGVFLGYGIFNGGNPILTLNDTLISFMKVFEDIDNTIIICVTLLLGALIHVIEKSGGIQGFVEFLTTKRAIIKDKKGANIFTWIMGILIFTSGTLSTLVVGSVTRPINDALKVPHEKLAFIVHTTSTPICVLIPLSGWGASMIGYLTSAGVESSIATDVLIKSIPLNFYCIIAVFSVLFFACTGKDFGPMKKAEIRASKTGLLDEPKNRNDKKIKEIDEGDVIALSNGKSSSAMNLIIPIVTLIGVIVTVLLVTGNGNIANGAGMVSILWGAFVSLVVSGIMYISQKIFTPSEYLDKAFEGASSMISIAAILVFAFSMGGVVKQLETGVYLANLLSGFLTPALLPALVFIMACIISFSTGTSLGTMAITMVIAIPMAATMGVSVELVAAAVFGGSIFGDHSTPISDTTIMTCSTTGCDVMDHIKTQLPYTLSFAVISIVLYIVAGFIM
ncbi:MAG: Na+/H+ antiporter NhaC family protein [Peptostreptococcaceae bacterium]